MPNSFQKKRTIGYNSFQMPSITRRSLTVVAEKYLGMTVEQRDVYLDELQDFAECGLCGTAAVISPVDKIVDHGKEICLPTSMSEMGEVTKKLYDTLTGILMGRIAAPEGWIHVIKQQKVSAQFLRFLRIIICEL